MTPTVPTTLATPTAHRRPGLFGWLLMAPLLLWLALFVIAPTAILLAYSFGQRDALGQAEFEWRDEKTGEITAFDNYLRVFDPAYLQVFTRSAGWAICGAAIGLAIALLWWHRTGRVGPESRAIWRGLIWGGVIAFFVGFDRSVDLVEGGNYLKILWRSVKYAAYTTIICVIAGYPVAYFIGRASEANRNRLLMLVMVPFWTSFLIRTYAWITILKREGLLNSFVDFAGVSFLLAKLVQFEFLAKWLSYRDAPYITAEGQFDLLYTPVAIMIGLVYSYLPFMILPIYGSVEKMDNALVEAAFDLGASPARAFGHVIIPLTQPGIVAGCLLVFIPAIGMFAIQDLMGGRRVQMIGNIIQNQFGQARNAPFGAALGMTLLLMFIVVFWWTSRKDATT
ncbi:MAG TPA: ABC transporter permease [Tepidisphaeraceae bacterium]|jgi:spermidine/putrescine transport system permease protein|nr:ABC transporter permease [Tepidisphaeraceae bacterium]